ncbi:hypothetical protein CXY01_17110 [Cellulomonas xylanilytica]|uniref:Uncharacterized protein n=2 Tax=Cellulomonas xylanilytica TaxID=233583 RepID=A0A510V5I3_9CELL|nr:hypothetical protein CXY01_17110 [Cellulomonas xylanilytica]
MTGVGTSRLRGELVLHPVALVGLAVLLVNDHVLKAAVPGWWTGKLSDLAGLAFFPFLLVALVDLARRRGHEPGIRTALVAACATAVVFTAIKTSVVARDLYAAAVGIVRFPVDALVWGAARPDRVAVVPDVTDVPAVVACALVVLVVHRRVRARR